MVSPDFRSFEKRKCIMRMPGLNFGIVESPSFLKSCNFTDFDWPISPLNLGLGTKFKKEKLSMKCLVFRNRKIEHASWEVCTEKNIWKFIKYNILSKRQTDKIRCCKHREIPIFLRGWGVGSTSLISDLLRVAAWEIWNLRQPMGPFLAQ